MLNAVAPSSKKTKGEAPIFSIAQEHRFEIDQAFIDQYRGKEPKWGPVGKVAYVRTYARELRGEELATHFRRDYGFDRKEARKAARTVKVKREEFWQTGRRVVEFVLSVFKNAAMSAHHPWDEQEAHEKSQEMFRRLWDFKWLPPGRGLQFAGTPVVEMKGAASINNCGFKSTKNLDLDFSDPFCVIMDFLMLGVGMGSDVQGAGKVRIQQPVLDPEWIYVVPDTREGWVESVRVKLDGYMGLRAPSGYDFTKIRKEGAVLKTFGGTASGPGPLIRLLERIDAILKPLIGQLITVTAIADIINHIGACVVAGNIRRSAEILIGRAGDVEFAALKDPTGLRALQDLRKDREDAIPEALRMKRQMAKYVKKQEGHSAASAEYLIWQAKIDRMEARRNKILAADPDWVTIDKSVWAHPLNDYRWASNNTMLFEPEDDFNQVSVHIAMNGEPGVAFMNNIRAYGRMERTNFVFPRKAKWLDPLVEGFNPCAEQCLEDNELCCLGELNPNAHLTLEDFLITIKFAYMYCKAVTMVPTNNKMTNRVMTKNRRIGLSMMGIFKMYERLGMAECIRWWDRGYQEVRKWDKTYSDWLGVNPSIKVTSVKPGGTVPLLVGEEGGMKVPTAEYFFRTMRVSKTSPLVKACKTAGYRVEDARQSPRTVVVYFPVHDPTKMRTAENVSMWEQMEILAALQAYWSDNMVSNTITFQPHEAADIPRAISAFANRVKAISFLPLVLHGYQQAAYIPITKTEYEAAANQIKPLELSTVGHEVDEKYCTGEMCMKL